jgi:hypothetical protein
MTTFADVAPMIAKLVRLLASDSPGEIVASVHALRRVLASAELDLHDLANVVEFPARREAPQIEATANPFSSMRSDVVREMVRRCSDRADLLSAKELAFVWSMARWRGRLSPGQIAWLVALNERCTGEPR